MEETPAVRVFLLKLKLKCSSQSRPDYFSLNGMVKTARNQFLQFCSFAVSTNEQLLCKYKPLIYWQLAHCRR